MQYLREAGGDGPQGRLTMHQHTDKPENLGQKVAELAHEYFFPHLNYFRLVHFPSCVYIHRLIISFLFRTHVLYFVVCCLIGGALMVAIDGIAYEDGLLIATSCMTGTGIRELDAH
jgi:hypothetical protein